MKTIKQPLLTIFVIFAAAYILTIIGCAPGGSSGGGKPVDPVAQQQGQSNADDSGLILIDANDMRECTDQEFSVLVDWSNTLAPAKEAILKMGTSQSLWIKKTQVVDQATMAIRKCDQVEFYHTLKPCKKTRREITKPDTIILVGAYDASRIDTRCKLVENYLNKFNLRPSKKDQVPQEPIPTPEPDPIPQPNPDFDPNLTPNEPTVPVKPPVVDNQPVLVGSDLPLCTQDEFSKLTMWRAALELSNKHIGKLGNQSNWKYDANAIDSSTIATKKCESLITYHTQKPCKREKEYTAQNLRNQCQTARTYFYEFAQHADSLIVPNAKLYFTTSVIANKTFSPGPANITLGEQCVITNISSSPITYIGQKALVTEARVYTNPESDAGKNMFVFATAEGLKFECYGIEYTSVKTSKSEVVRLLKNKGTQVPLFYELN